jgi:hypothetical protein
MLELNRQDYPPSAGPEIWIKRLKANETFHARIISPQFWGLWIHWYGRHTEPCLKDRQECPGCKAEAIRKWKGYLHVISVATARQWFYEATPFVAKQITGQIAVNASLCGMRVEVVRGKGDKARCYAILKEPFPHMPPLPAVREPRETLEILWKMQGCTLRVYTPPEIPNSDCA